MRKLAIIAALTALPLLSLPSYAADLSQPNTSELRNPWVAASLGWGVTGAALYSETYLELPRLGIGSPLATIATLGPLGFGAGHIYAGDYGRGALVSLGGPIVVTGTGLLCQAVYRAANPFRDPMSMDLNAFSAGWLVAILAYGSWASWDAYQTTERLNQERALGPYTAPLPPSGQ